MQFCSATRWNHRQIFLLTDWPVKYSVENLLEFLKNHLIHDGQLAVQWTGIVRLQSDGLQCLLPSETWSAMHFEDLLDSEIEWHQGKGDGRQAKMSRCFIVDLDFPLHWSGWPELVFLDLSQTSTSSAMDSRTDPPIGAGTFASDITQ